MKKVLVTVHRDYLEDVIKILHETGLVEITDIKKEETPLGQELKSVEINPIMEKFSDHETRLSRIISILSKTKKSLGGIKAFLNPPQPIVKTIKERSAEEILSHSEKILQEIESTILGYEEKLNELEEQKNKINSDREQILYLKDFDIDFSYITDSDQIIVRVGRTSGIEDLKNQIKSDELIELQSKQFGVGKKREWAVLIIAHTSEKEKIDLVCREKISLFNVQHLECSPKDALKKLAKEQAKLDHDKDKILSALRSYTKDYLDDILALREEIQLEHIRKEIPKNFTETDFTYTIQGWVLEKNEHSLQSNLTEASEDNIICSFENPSVNPDNPPTYLETPKGFAFFQTFLKLFATPKYDELNPTIFMGLFFIVFFSLMLGDAGYGLVILIFSLIGYFIVGKHSSMIKSWSFVGILLGALTTVIGVLMNSLFGDFIPRFFYGDPSAPLFSATILGVHIPIDSLREPLTVLTIALIFGLIHLNLGVLLGSIQSLKKKQFKSFVTQNLCWVPLEIGGATLVGNFIFKWPMESTMLYIGGALTLLGVILLFIHTGPMGFFGITGFVGDWLSYARLLALGLATSGMAVAFNVVGQLFSSMIPFIGFVILPILLIVLHTANLLIQSLGAGVHSLRLQYVEFFNRFYEGGGRDFSPFRMSRRYTRIEKIKHGGKI